MAEPCATWDVDPTDVCPGWADYTSEVKDAALKLATFWLWAATGRRFGPCPVVVRPAQKRGEPLAYQTFPVIPGGDSMGVQGGPYLYAGRWYNAGCTRGCCGEGGCAIVLRGPVYAVDEVLVDGAEVLAEDYRVDVVSGAWLLVRTDGACWPVCQNFTSAVTEPGTFQVTYGLGEQIPAALELAAGRLACEYGKQLTGGKCALPAKMTRLSRQGVEIEVEPPAPGEGRTGIKMVDDVVTALNPTGRRQPPRVLSLDLPEQCDRFPVTLAGS